MNYLWCVEKASLACAALLIGLVINISLNAWLLPRYGLAGAAWATSAANFVILVVVYAMARLNGMRLSRATWLMALAPLLPCVDTRLACVALIGLAVKAVVGHGLLSEEERARLSHAWLEFAHRFEAFRPRHVDQT
jgi:O-antigen/teichoic acid export membrane protein